MSSFLIIYKLLLLTFLQERGIRIKLPDSACLCNFKRTLKMNRLLRLFTCVPYACAALHHLLTPSTSSNAVYALEFDDASGTLSLIAESTTVDMHLSIAVDVKMPGPTIFLI